jgi:hypothetical protein
VGGGCVELSGIVFAVVVMLVVSLYFDCFLYLGRFCYNLNYCLLACSFLFISRDYVNS